MTPRGGALHFDKGQYRQALSYLDQYSATVGSLSRGQKMLQGWAYHRLGWRSDAVGVFSAIQAQAPGADSLRALSTARKGVDR